MDLNEVKNFILTKTKRNATVVGDRLPAHTDSNGCFAYTEKGWVGGFWSGLNYYCCLMSGDMSFAETAERVRHRLVNRLYDKEENLDHDIGFLYIPTELARYKILGKEESKIAALHAADLLAERFNENGGFIQAWNVWNSDEEFSLNNRGRIIIDCMYNIPLLFWASEVTGDKRYYDIANSHARATMNTIVRSDFTTYHTYVFNPDTGEPLFGQTAQGYSDNSCWARGQAWTIGGFTAAYNFTGNKEYLAVAQKAADVFIENTEDDYIPMWDLCFKGSKDEPRDASAACIAASGLLSLGQYYKKYKQNAQDILESLWENYTSKNEPEYDGLIKHCTGHKPAGKQIDSSLIYADYYFAECICRLLKIDPILY